MIRIFIMIFSLAISSSFAAMVTIAGKDYSCEKQKDVTEIYLCNSNTPKVLIVNTGFGYSAYSKEENGKFTMTMVSKILENKKVLYETPTYPGGGNVGFGTADTLSNRKMMASLVMNNLKDYKNEFAKRLREDAKKFIQNAKRPKLVNFKTKDQNFLCESGESRKLSNEEKIYAEKYSLQIGCDYFSCKDKDGREALAYIPQDGSMVSPNILLFFPEGKEKNIWNDIQVVSAELKDEGMLIYDSPKLAYGIGGYGLGISPETKQPSFQEMYPNTDKIEKNDYLPFKLKGREEFYQAYSSPMAAPTIKYTSELCKDPKINTLINRRDKIVNGLAQAVIDEKLIQIISLIEGRLVGTLMPEINANKYGCLYDGMIISPKAQVHLNYLKHLNEKFKDDNFISEKKAQELFNKAKAMKDIPFGYKYDGCYARAHVMAKRFEAMGVKTEKVWIKGDLSVPNTDIRWNFHVAPVVTVKEEKSGAIKKYVIDPSLTDKAVPLDDWVNTMKPNVKGAVVKTSYPIPFNAADMERTAVALSTSEPYLPDGNMTMTEDEKDAAAKDTMIQYSKYLKKE